MRCDTAHFFVLYFIIDCDLHCFVFARKRPSCHHRSSRTELQHFDKINDWQGCPIKLEFLFH